MAVRWSVDWYGGPLRAYQRNSLTDGWKLLEQGVQRQAASNRCWVGPSSVMNASDLDIHSFNDALAFGIGVKAHCPQKQKIQN